MDRCDLVESLPRGPCCFFGAGHFFYESKGRCTFVYYQKSSMAPHGRCAGFGACKHLGGRAYVSEDDHQAMEDIGF